MYGVFIIRHRTWQKVFESQNWQDCQRELDYWIAKLGIPATIFRKL